MANNPLRIAFITNNYTPYRGGVVSSIMALDYALRMQGHEVFIITLDFLPDELQDSQHVIRIKSLYTFRYKNNPIAIPLAPYHQLEKQLTAIDPDILHVHHPFLLGKASLQFAQKTKKPIVFQHHSLYEEYAHYIPLPRWLVHHIIRSRLTSFCQSVNSIVAPSRWIKNYLQERAITTNINVIPSCLRKEYTDLSFMPKIKKVASRFELIVVSRLVQEKNVQVALDLFSLLDQERYCLTIIGYGYDEQRLKDYAYQKMKFSEDTVSFLAMHHPQDLIQAYKKADLFIFTSTVDTQGIVLAESMACSTPVVALNGPGQKDSIINGYNGFLASTINEMKNIIESIARNSDMHKALQQGSYESSKRYRSEYIGTQVEALYYDLLAVSVIK
jgi:glycosyltransferase involved in cell wall biosynthesis